MAFFTIHPAEGLSPAQRRRASRDGPVAVAAPHPHREMLETAGFVEVAEIDYSAEFVAVAQAWVDQWAAHHEAMAAIWGPEVVEQRQRDRRALIRATEDNILRRSLYTARRP